MAKTSSTFFVVVLVALSYEMTTATNTCTWGFFKCGSSTQCIVSRRRCDGVRHCTNGADETSCPSRCSGYNNNFKCSNGFCISRSYLCNGVNNCRDSSDESISLCGGTVFPVRLVGGSSPNQGRVEVYYAEDRTWGTVCDDNWGINDANVVCRQLGLPSATQAVGSARFGQGSGPILLDNMRCSGTETSLSKCSSSGWKAHDCSHSEDAGVVCGGSTLPPLIGRLRCYSCSSSSSSCSATTTCSSWQRYCYKKTADRTTGGLTSRVTVAGCRSSCTSADRIRACSGEANCQMTCCSSSLCNHVSGGGDSSYPSCYTCSSSSSYKDCDAKGSLTTCTSRNSYCYKMHYKTKSVWGKMHVYRKGCTYSSSSCSQMRSTYCNSLVTDECKVYCCSGKGCNAGSVQRFSIAALLTCAVASFYNLKLHANF